MQPQKRIPLFNHKQNSKATEVVDQKCQYQDVINIFAQQLCPIFKDLTKADVSRLSDKKKRCYTWPHKAHLKASKTHTIISHAVFRAWKLSIVWDKRSIIVRLPSGLVWK